MFGISLTLSMRERLSSGVSTLVGLKPLLDKIASSKFVAIVVIVLVNVNKEFSSYSHKFTIHFIGIAS